MTLLQQNGFFLRSPKDNKLYGKIDSLKPGAGKKGPESAVMTIGHVFTV